MDDEDRPPEYDLGRRVAAARAYRDLDQVTAAKACAIRPATLGNYEEGKIPAKRRPFVVDQSVKAFELPEEFFTIGLRDARMMAEVWRRAQQLADPGDLLGLIDEAVRRARGDLLTAESVEGDADSSAARGARVEGELRARPGRPKAPVKKPGRQSSKKRNQEAG